MATHYLRPPRDRLFTDVDGKLATYKDDDEEIFYSLDWSTYLGGSSITSSTWTSDGLTLDSPSFTDTTTRVRISGSGSEAKNTISTGGETFVQSIRVYAIEK